MFEVGERVLMIYPEGDADHVTITHLFAQIAFVDLPNGQKAVTLLENLCPNDDEGDIE